VYNEQTNAHMIDSYITPFFIYHSYMFILNILQYDIYTFIQLFITDRIQDVPGGM